MTVRCQYELGHLLFGAHVRARPADSFGILCRRMVDSHGLDSRPITSGEFEGIPNSSGRRIIRVLDRPVALASKSSTGITGRRRLVHQ